MIGDETIERVIPGLGTLRFENLGPGQWTTKAGEPAKTRRRRYVLIGDDGTERELDSVSSIVGCLDKPALVIWGERMGAVGAIQAQRAGVLDGASDDQIITRMHTAGYGAVPAKEQAADRGLITHSVLQTFAETGEPPDFGDYPVEVRPWVSSAVQLWYDLKPVPAESELIVCHPGLGYAGRLDFICYLDGRRTILDYKSGKGRVYAQAHWQSRGYADALIPSGVDPVDDIFIVGISENGYQLVKCAATSEDFVALVHTFRAGKRVNAAMAAERKANK